MRYFLLFIFFSSLIAMAQSRESQTAEPIVLKNTRWRTNIHCFEEAAISGYELSVTNDTLNFQWGNYISFSDSTFNTNYSAPCGNDCFTSVTGTYQWVGANHIEIFVHHIQRNGFCKNGSEEVEKTFGIYRVFRSKDGLRLEQDQK